MGDHDNLLSDEQMREFIANGYVVLKADLSEAIHEQIREGLDLAYTKEGNPGNNILPRIPALQKVFNHPVITGALTSVLGADYIMHPHRHGHFNQSSEAGGWHKDSYWGYDKIRNHHPWWAMIFYYPQDVTPDMGPTGIMPGTQSYQERNFASDESEMEMKLLGNRGSFVLVQYDMWHRSNANVSGKDRYMLKFQFVRTQEPKQASWNNKTELWAAPTSLATDALSHEVMWRENWNWLRGYIGEGARESIASADTDQTKQWLAEMLSSDQAIRVRAADQLSLHGSQDQRDGIIAALTRALADSYEPVALNAAYGLARLGERGIIALVDGICNEKKAIARASGYGASTAGSLAVKPLIDLIQSQSKQPQAIAHAAFALGELRGLAAEAVPVLVQLMDHPDVFVRRTSVEALGCIKARSEEITEALQKGLKDSDAQVRFTSGLSLSRMGAGAEAAVPALIEALDDENRYVRANAVEALHNIDTKAAHNALFQFLKTARWCPDTTPESTFYP